jgi:hypothetical protein
MRLRATPILALVTAMLLAFSGGRAQDAPPSEYRLKAAFLFNFAKFVEWPPEAFAETNSPFVIGVLGDSPFGEELAQTVGGKDINAHPITLQTFRVAAEATNCHLLFVSTSEQKRLLEIIPRLRGAAILTVGETERFIEAGGMINFVSENHKIRFQINDDAAKGARLKISSKLLSLAVPSVR